MTPPKDPESTPRLCYVGSLQVEATSASMMLLHRLLETYPADRLQVIFTKEDARLPERPERRLQEVVYHELRPSFSRGWYFTRMKFPRLFWMMLQIHAWWQARQAAKLLGSFRPDAIVTIHEQFGWITAEKLARRLKLPLHLILHDDWFRNIPMAGVLREKFERYFKDVYRSAASRLCISPYMEEAYGRRYGAPGTVIYPSRSRNALLFNAPPAPPAGERPPLRVAYGGNVFHQGYWEALRFVAEALEPSGGRLLIFGPSKADALKHGLTGPNVVAHGFVFNLVEAVREQADVLFLPMTFEPHERPNMEVSFPSKLTEYTAAGLPLLIYGPDYCSAVRWARSHPETAEVVTTQGLASLAVALEKLRDPAHRGNLGRHALELGHRYFSFETGVRLFREAVAPDASRRDGENDASRSG